MSENMDIVYLYKNSGNDEIVYSLRSLANLPHNKVFIVGDMPKYINPQNILYIKAEQGLNKYQNTTNALRLACHDDRLSDDFIVMNDDFFILKKIENPREELNLHKGTIAKVYERLSAKYPLGSGYLHGMKETETLLKNLGIKEPLSYELHTPFIFNKYKLLQMFETYADEIAQTKCFHKRSFYGNLYVKGSKFMKDIKVLALDNFVPTPEQKFISSSDSSYRNLKYILMQKFSKKSKYEEHKK
jgi:hypothetical protein